MKISLLLFLLPLFTSGQVNKLDEDNPFRLNSKRYAFESKYLAPRDVKLTFSSIKIIDNRFDTSKIGYTKRNTFLGATKKAFSKIDFKDGVEKSFEQFYNSYYENAFDKSGFTLVMVLKKFWYSLVSQNKSKAINILRYDRNEASIYYKIDYYLEKNSQYLPLKRVDSVININDEMVDLLNDNVEDKEQFLFVKNLLKHLVEKYDFSPGLKAFNNYPKKNYVEIQNYNKKMFDIKILEDSVFTKGVYLNFKDFKENKPSILNFVEKKSRYSSIRKEEFIEDENGKAINQLWGYSDGSFFKIGIYSHDKIYRVNNTFEFFVPAVWYIQNTNTPGNSGLVIPSNIRNEIWIPMQIDMETGQIY